MTKQSRLYIAILILILALSSCNLPSNTPDTGDVRATAAALTVEAQLALFTQEAPATTAPGVPTNTGVAAPPTLPPTFTSVAPQPTATQNCDKASLSSETYPDGTKLSPNESFTKTWRLKNTGTCSWTSSYQMVFVSGDSMGGPAAVSLTGNVNSGQEIDIPVDLIAPASTGTYKGTWKLRNAAGVYFATVWVEIKVETAAFAVTSVTTTVSPDSYSGSCAGGKQIVFTFEADITANGPGDVTYVWKRSDNASGPTETVTFAAAGTKTVTTTWTRTFNPGDTATGWEKVYIDDPNHQLFSPADFSVTCDP